MSASRVVAICVCLSALSTWAQKPSTYQVTGPITALSETTITVEKGKDKWELKRGDAKVEGGELKVGEKVTITYAMSAESIEVKKKPKKAGTKD